LLSGTVDVLVRAVPVGAPADAGVDLITIPVKLKIKPGGAKRLSLKFVVPVDLAVGNYTLSATLDSGLVLAESNEADNVATAAGATIVG
jgi:subtilase family serine protease